MNTEKTNYLAIIGDLIDSRKLGNREALQAKMLELLETINTKYADQIVSRFTMTIGDEFQALLKPQGGVWQVLDHLAALSPARFRMGLGYGTIITKINPEQSIGADGEAFWRARDAIQIAHKENWNNKSHVFFEGTKDKTDRVINVLMSAGEVLKFAWNETSRETLREMLNVGVYHPNFVQKELADAINIDPRTLNKRLLAGNIKIYLEIRATLGQILEDYNELSE